MSEVEEYKEQLKDIEESLKLDPQNESLLELQKELKDLLSLLTEESEQPSKEEKPEPSAPQPSTTADKETSTQPVSSDASPSPAPQQSVGSFKVGDVVYVKPRLEKEYQEVKITIISGNGKLITVKFGDDKTDTYPVEEVRSEKPKFVKNKYKLKQQKTENQAKKKLEQDEQLNKGAQSWQNFSKKSKSLKKSRSQFGTSDSVGSKVGVVNSGKPMTKKKDKNHRYNPY